MHVLFCSCIVTHLIYSFSLILYNFCLWDKLFLFPMKAPVEIILCILVLIPPPPSRPPSDVFSNIQFLTCSPGYFGISQQACLNQGCCWNPADVSFSVFVASLANCLAVSFIRVSNRFTIHRTRPTVSERAPLLQQYPPVCQMKSALTVVSWECKKTRQ